MASRQIVLARKKKKVSKSTIHFTKACEDQSPGALALSKLVPELCKRMGFGPEVPCDVMEIQHSPSGRQAQPLHTDHFPSETMPGNVNVFIALTSLTSTVVRDNALGESAWENRDACEQMFACDPGDIYVCSADVPHFGAPNKTAHDQYKVVLSFGVHDVNEAVYIGPKVEDKLFSGEKS